MTGSIPVWQVQSPTADHYGRASLGKQLFATSTALPAGCWLLQKSLHKAVPVNNNNLAQNCNTIMTIRVGLPVPEIPRKFVLGPTLITIHKLVHPALRNHT